MKSDFKFDGIKMRININPTKKLSFDLILNNTF